MSGVDVLAVLRLAYRHLNGGPDSLSPKEHAKAFFGMRDAIPAVAELIEALKLQQRMNREALTKFNWGASALDANAIDLLNRAPAAVDAALAAATGESHE